MRHPYHVYRTRVKGPNYRWDGDSQATPPPAGFQITGQAGRAPTLGFEAPTLSLLSRRTPANSLGLDEAALPRVGTQGLLQS